MKNLKTIDDLILLKIDGETAGTISMAKTKENSYYLSLVCIFSEYRGRSYCPWLVRQVITNEKYKGYKIELEVDHDNDIARHCYEKAGFIKESRKRGYDVYVYQA